MHGKAATQLEPFSSTGSFEFTVPAQPRLEVDLQMKMPQSNMESVALGKIPTAAESYSSRSLVMPMAKELLAAAEAEAAPCP